MKISNENVFTNVYLPNTNEIDVLSIISKAIAGKINIDEQEIKSGFLSREALGSTALGGKVAIPHANSSDVNEIQTFVFTFDNQIDWRSEDGEPVNIVIALIMPRNNHQEDYQEIVDDLRNDLKDNILVDKLQSSLDDPDSLVELLSETTVQK
ncbi:PTS sugar transporter subunit IIA [Companilactobacillus sp. HBUAS59699]|uniref:PTS sugar transporter subunit IIA n=1 Tax=Companilactobacillus sp. HBUAS59699 TaxID=3109358 RepID=UPI002FF2AEC2